MPKYSRRRWLSNSALLLGSVFAGSALTACTSAPNRLARRNGLRLVFYTDVHAMVKRRAPEAILQAAMAINTAQPDLILGGGDYIDGGFTSTREAIAPHWDIYMNMHNALQAPVFPAIGNHDLVNAQEANYGALVSDDPRKEYRQYLDLSETWYSFDEFGYHFIVLDSMNVVGGELGYEGRLNDDQLEWLREDISRTSRNTPIVLCLHMPLLTSLYAATRGNEFGGPANRVMVDNVAVLELFSRHNLILVLQGHLHVAEVIRWRDITFITGGAICGNWWRGQRLGTEEGFYVIDLNDNRVNWEYVDYGWDV